MTMAKIPLFEIDMTKIRGKGEFKCPKCGRTISPDDETERTYAILEPVMKNGHLDSVVLECKSCGSQIHLTGFNVLK